MKLAVLVAVISLSRAVLVEDLGIGTTDEVSNMRYRLKFGDDLWPKSNTRYR